jgi:hypothetical protein
MLHYAMLSILCGAMLCYVVFIELDDCLCWVLVFRWLILRSSRYRRYVSPKCWALSELDYITAQQAAFVIVTVLKTSNPTNIFMTQTLCSYYKFPPFLGGIALGLTFLLYFLFRSIVLIKVITFSQNISEDTKGMSYTTWYLPLR